MKKARLTDSQIIDAFKGAETRLAFLDLCRGLGISAPAIYNLRVYFVGIDSLMMTRMKELKIEKVQSKNVS